MIVRKFSEAKPYEAPNHRDYKSLRLFGAEVGGSQDVDRSASRISCPAAAPGRTPRRPRRSTTCWRASSP